MNKNLRLLLVEDDSFTRQLLVNALTQQGFEIQHAANASDAALLLESFEPHIVVTDLDLGGTGASGIDLLHRVQRDRPWVGLVALTAHANPRLAAEGQLPESVLYLVKSEIDDLGSLGNLIRSTLAKQSLEANQGETEMDTSFGLKYVSATQAEVLRMLAQGMSNSAIAEARGTSIRAVENMIGRIYDALEVEATHGRNRRIEAVRLWQAGVIRVQ